MALSKNWKDLYTGLDLREEETLIVNSYLNMIKNEDIKDDEFVPTKKSRKKILEIKFDPVVQTFYQKPISKDNEP